MIIVIDGPAGSGKSSTAKAIANRLNLKFLDSGALYRAVTYYWIQKGRPNKSEFFNMLPGMNLDARYEDDAFIVSVNGKSVNTDIRKQYVAEHVSEIATQPEVRQFVNAFMRQLIKNGVYIADGRDLGTAVFPDADLKFYMDASIKERAKRRYKEAKQNDPEITLDQIAENLKNRDYKDQNRKADPLKKADDAITIDTTGKTFEEQVSEIISIIKENVTLKH